MFLPTQHRSIGYIAPYNSMPSCRCLSLVSGGVVQAWTVERAVPQHIVDSFTVGGRSLGRKLSTYKRTARLYRKPYTDACECKPRWVVTVRLPGRPLWCRASQPNTRSWQRRTKGPNSKTPAFFGSARRPRASHSSALTDSVRPPPVDKTYLDEMATTG